MEKQTLNVGYCTTIFYIILGWGLYLGLGKTAIYPILIAIALSWIGLIYIDKHF